MCDFTIHAQGLIPLEFMDAEVSAQKMIEFTVDTAQRLYGLPIDRYEFTIGKETFERFFPAKDASMSSPVVCFGLLLRYAETQIRGDQELRPVIEFNNDDNHYHISLSIGAKDERTSNVSTHS